MIPALRNLFSSDDTPATFNAAWLRNARRFYLIFAIPLALLCISLDGGWSALRIALHGYAQTSGVVTDVHCGSKYSSLEYTYYAGKYPQHSDAPNPGCRRYAPGATVTVYYSTQNPALSVINVPPGRYFRHDLKTAFLIALLAPAFLALLGTVKERFGR